MREIFKLLYYKSNGTDSTKFWQMIKTPNDFLWVVLKLRPGNPRWQTAAILKNHKNCRILATV